MVPYFAAAMIHAGGRAAPQGLSDGPVGSSVPRLLTHSVSIVVDRTQMEANGDADEEQREKKVKKMFCAVD